MIADGAFPGFEEEAPKEKPAKQKNPRPDVVIIDDPQPDQVPSADFDQFVREFWTQGSSAVDVLMLPEEIRLKVMKYVDDALSYGYYNKMFSNLKNK